MNPNVTATGLNINSLIENVVDRGLWMYYDTITITQGATLAAGYTPFAIPIGQSSQTKLQTNMTQSNSFPTPRCLILDQIGFYFSSDLRLADITLLLKNYYLEFRISEKIYFEGPLWQFGAGFGVTGVTTQTNESVYSLSAPFWDSPRKFGKYGKYIAPMQQFSFNLITPNTSLVAQTTAQGGTGILVVPFLHGLTDRAVQ